MKPTVVSNRVFGLQVGAALLVIVGIGVIRGWSQLTNVTFALLGGLLIFLGYLLPKSLSKLNRIWMGLGNILSKIVSPISLFLVFAIFFVPLGLFMRARGRDPLKLRRYNDNSYWIPRADRNFKPDSFERQY